MQKHIALFCNGKLFLSTDFMGFSYHAWFALEGFAHFTAGGLGRQTVAVGLQNNNAMLQIGNFNAF